MATIFNNMATLASATGSSFVQQKIPSKSSAVSKTLTESLSAPSPTSSSGSSLSCESGIVLSGISFCSSLTNSPTSSTISPSPSVTATNALASSANSVSAGLLTASLLAAVSSVSTSSTGSMSLQSSTHASVTTSPESVSFPSDITSSHQLLLSGLGVTETDLNVVNSSSISEDPRALQLALELSMVGLNDTMQLQVHQQQLQLQQIQQQHLQHMQQQHMPQQQQQSSFDMSALSAAVAAAAAVANNQIPTSASQLNQFPTTLLSGLEDRSKKSQNMTECVPVPSSEHVAEIVGRQGCKIKALRAKTNTYIKTPVRGEEPVFVVTGRKEDVAKAKREILSAAEHFSVIRASRKPSLAGSFNGSMNCTGSCSKSPPGPPTIPGQVTIQVRVPYRVVGLVVGPKGATIKHIQQETQTYIVTPSREKEPIFEVTGLPDNVQAARKQIEAHIALRTGNLTSAGESSSSPNCNSVHTINSLTQILSDDISPEVLASIYKNGICSTFDYADGATSSGFPIVMSNHSHLNSNLTTGSQSLLNILTSSTSNPYHLKNGIGNDFLNNIVSGGIVENSHHILSGGLNLTSDTSDINTAGHTSKGINIKCNGISTNATSSGLVMSRSCSSASSTTSSKSANNSGGSNSSRPELSNIWKNLGDSLDVDEGIGESPSIWTMPTPVKAKGSHYSPSTSISPTDSLFGESNNFGQLLITQPQNRITSDSNNIVTQHQQNHQQHFVTNHNNHPTNGNRECLLCGDKDMKTSLLLCGHNMFCMECTKKI